MTLLKDFTSTRVPLETLDLQESKSREVSNKERKRFLSLIPFAVKVFFFATDQLHLSKELSVKLLSSYYILIPKDQKISTFNKSLGQHVITRQSGHAQKRNL